MLWKRMISAMIGIPLAVAVIYYGGWIMTLAVGLLAMGGVYEYRQMLLQLETDPPAWISYPLVIAVVLTAHYGGQQVSWILTAAGLTMLAHLVFAYPDGKPQESAAAITGALTITWLMGHLILLRQLPAGVEAVLLTFLITWSTDTGAYFVGRALGKRPLAAKLSPKKTLEGSMGGLIAAALVGAYVGPLWFPHIPLPLWIGVTLLVSALGQFGDLAESALKRLAGVKDSGNLIPGHGGVLDRFDSILWTAPSTYYFLLFCERFLQ
ncbi:phosphatidate cytidylyltransferase [Heliobacterium chlorum]|uniref:Phosphatidate cytidylyltransferase n=1 Tax=Heliobacterium chlorum TaxID=2698 RepID=A0ABR7SYE5_HELCL|nr:phosphatidate cytidylyltransferase [Heliobacterium chlorum]MBC9783451.1 phosphatidate cytidylyltransferase [Heliobacterium chlorum]